MKIGLISDSHDAHENVRRAVAIFKEHGVANVIHAGDICSPPTIRALQAHAEAAFDFFAVFGNNDGERHKLTKLLGDRIDEFLELEFEGITVAVYHGTV